MCVCFYKTLSLRRLCVLGRSEHVSAHSNHGNAAWAGRHGSSYPECRRLPPALPDVSTSHSLSGTASALCLDLGFTKKIKHSGLIAYWMFDLHYFHTSPRDSGWLFIILVLWGHTVEMLNRVFLLLLCLWPLQGFFSFSLSYCVYCHVPSHQAKSPFMAEQATNVGINAFPIKHQNSASYLFPCAFPQAAINAMNLEQQLSQYAFFNQQPSSQNHQNQQVSFSSSIVSTQADCYGKDLTAALRSHIFSFWGQFELSGRTKKWVWN